MTGIIVKTNGVMYAKNFDDKLPLYKTVGETVGGYIEIVHPKRLEAPFVMIVNEEGPLRGLPLNSVGSVLYETDIHGSPIVGDVVIMKEGYTNKGPDIIGLSDEEVYKVMDLIPKVIASLKGVK